MSDFLLRISVDAVLPHVSCEVLCSVHKGISAKHSTREHYATPSAQQQLLTQGTALLLWGRT